MPTYDYRCDACDATFELFQSIKADAVKLCPACGGEKARRVIGKGGGLIFKGSGFYITDYRSKDYAEKAKSESAASSSQPSGPGSGSAGSKPEAKGTSAAA